MSWFHHLKTEKCGKSENLLCSQTSVRQELKRCLALRFALYFLGGSERLRGISLRFIFLLLLPLSSSLHFKLSLLQTLIITSPHLSPAQLRSWQGGIAERWHCERIMKMIKWAGNLVSLKKNSHQASSLAEIYEADRCAFTPLVQILVIACMVLPASQEKPLFVIELSIWFLDISNSLCNHPLMQMSPVMLWLKISPWVEAFAVCSYWYCGAQDWRCDGVRAALMPQRHNHEVHPTQGGRAGRQRVEATGVFLVLLSLFWAH